jgi:protein subunit release factor A
MICDELERLEAEFDDLVSALEDPRLTNEEKQSLEKEYARLSHVIQDHQKSGHRGGPCFEE